MEVLESQEVILAVSSVSRLLEVLLVTTVTSSSSTKYLWSFFHVEGCCGFEYWHSCAIVDGCELVVEVGVGFSNEE